VTTASDDFNALAAGESLAGAWTQAYATTGGDMRRGTSGDPRVAADATYTHAFVIRNDISPGAAQFSQITQAESAQGAAYGYACVRMAGANATLTCYALRWRVGETGYEIGTFDGSTETFTAIGAAFTSGAADATDVMKLEVSSTTLTAYRNAVSLGTRTDATYSSGAVGFGQRNEDASAFGQLDDWSGGDIASAFIDFCPSHSEDMTDSGDM
jgi:hypothetical protein